MFDKEKGKFAKLFNLVIILILIGLSIALATELINTLLPTGGNYSNVNFSYSFLEMLRYILYIGVIGGLLFANEKKLDLFSKYNPLSKKILNLTIYVGLCYLIISPLDYLLCKIFSYGVSAFDIKEYCSILLGNAILYYLVDILQILKSSNGKINNFLNYISICAVNVCCSGVVGTVFDVNKYVSAVDFVRAIIIYIIIMLIFLGVLYFINFKHNEK